MMYKRFIGVYDKISEKLVKEIPLNDKHEFIIRKIFSNNEDQLLFGSYEINKSQAKLLQEKLNIEFNFNEYDYCLDTYAKD